MKLYDVYELANNYDSPTSGGQYYCLSDDILILFGIE